MKNWKYKAIGIVCGLLLFVGASLVFRQNSAKAAEYTISTNGQWVNGSVTKGVDFWKFTIPSAGTVTYTFQSYAADGRLDLKDVDLVDTYSHVSADGSTTNPSTSEESTNLEAGTYYLKARHSWDDGWTWTGTYRLKVSFTPANNTEKEPNNSFDTAMVLQKNQLIKGFISETDSLDFYKITVSKAQTIQVIYNFSTRFYFSVWNSDLIAVEGGDEDDYESGTHEWECYLQPGTYYLKVRSWYSDTGTYTIKYGVKQYVSSIKLKSSKVTLTKGKSYSLLKSVLPSDASNKSLTWESDNTDIATVNAAGVVKAKRPGYTTIRAKSRDGSDIEASAVVIVKPAKAALSSLKRNTYNKRQIYAYAKSMSGVSGYQYAWSKSKKFKKKKTYTTSSTSMYVTLKKKTKYYFKVRTYVEYNGKKYYGAWSKVKKIKTKS